MSRHFQPLAIIVTHLQTLGEMHCRAQRTDPPNRFLHHLFDDVDLSALQVDLMAFRDQPENGHHTGAKRRRNQIGGRKRLAAPTVVQRCVGAQAYLAGAMRGGAVKLTIVNGVDFY